MVHLPDIETATGISHSTLGGLALVTLAPWVPLAPAGWALFGLGLAGGVPQLFTAAGNLDVRASGALMARVVGLGYVGLLAGPAIVGGRHHRRAGGCVRPVRSLP
ncbi:MAG: hypothetical protein JXA67_20100 [Micromonosporaceae bacterium]|nr:hypothetical protein [Micromonosporaceae bacterium]